jgi:hypothetical protein
VWCFSKRCKNFIIHLSICMLSLCTGTTILVYTFPIIFIATLACLYHHLMQKASAHSTERYIYFMHFFISSADFFFLILIMPNQLNVWLIYCSYNYYSKIGFLRKASWRKPLLVNGPLGIISKIEFSFIIMFVLLLIWSLCSYLHGMFAKVALQAAYEREQV